ncbi:MAG: HD domain-containing protein [Patescibacteria group bacterium]
MLDKNTLIKIKDLALKIDHDVSFAGKSKGNRHLFRVVQVAKFLAERSEACVPVVIAGALLHDTALPTGDDYSYENNKRIIIDLLKPFNLSEHELQAVAECVASHEGIVVPKTLEAQIVHDADVLEKVGLLGLIRHTWKMTNLQRIDHENIKDEDVKMIVDHVAWRREQLKTNLANEIGVYLDLSISMEKADTIVRLSSPMAFNGVITEKIAEELESHLSTGENKKLQEQLTLSYLGKFK